MNNKNNKISTIVDTIVDTKKYNKSVEKPKTTCYGITNRCEDGSYILFMDYDNIYLHVLLDELKKLRDRFPKLAKFLILESTKSIMTQKGKVLGSYHAISFTKMPYQKMREILQYTSVDDDFFKLPKKTAYRTNTLRISPKYAWEEQYDAETNEPVGKSEVLKDEPKFLFWFPDEENNIKKPISEAHLKAYKKLKKFKMPEEYFNGKWIPDQETKIELKQYDSLKG